MINNNFSLLVLGALFCLSVSPKTDENNRIGNGGKGIVGMLNLPDFTPANGLDRAECAIGADIPSHSRSRGLFAGVSPGGPALRRDNDGNEGL